MLKEVQHNLSQPQVTLQRHRMHRLEVRVSRQSHQLPLNPISCLQLDQLEIIPAGVGTLKEVHEGGVKNCVTVSN